MSESTDKGKILYCSFCGKSQHEVRKLIAGPSVYICDECVDLCNDIIREELEAAVETESESLPTPHEIHEFLNGYRSEEHTSELQSRGHLVCRLLLEKKKKQMLAA